MALAGLAIFVAYVWSGRYWLDLIDEGYFVYLGYRVHAGDLPYRDFDTYYTPGIFYLFAWTFDVAGVSVEPIRVLMSGMRVLWALLLYLLARRIMPSPFALLPFALLAAVDAAPLFPEPHPSWPSMLAALAVMEAVVRHRESGRGRWLLLAGALAGVSLAFKQNIGAFAALAIGAHILLTPRSEAGRLVHFARLGYLLLLALAATALLRPGLNAPLIAVVWAPLIVTLGLIGWSSWRHTQASIGTTGWLAGLRPVIREGLLAGGPFVLVTLLWLVPLTLALGVRGVPWGLFLGQVNQGALILPLELPSPGTSAVVIASIWAPLLLALLSGWRGLPGAGGLVWAIGASVVVSVLVWLVPVSGPPETALIEDPSFYPWLGYLDRQLGLLFTYLPGIAAWGGLATLAAQIARGNQAGLLGWYLLAGGLLTLSLYPRVDTIHALFAGPPLLIVGAGALAAVYRTLAGRAHPLVRTLVFGALLILPIAAAAPHAYWRYVTIIHADPRSLTPPEYVELGLQRAHVRLPENFARSIRGAVEFVQAGTPLDESFFAYPVVPMFNFLADRPNPTRHNHFIAGALTPSDLDEVIHDLDTKKPRYILWDHGGVTYFKAELTNRALHDYIWRCYEQVDNYTPFLMLERRCP